MLAKTHEYLRQQRTRAAGGSLKIARRRWRASEAERTRPREPGLRSSSGVMEPIRRGARLAAQEVTNAISRKPQRHSETDGGGRGRVRVRSGRRGRKKEE